MHSTGLGPLEGAGNMWCLASDSFMSRQGGRRNHMKHFMILDSVVLEAEEWDLKNLSKDKRTMNKKIELSYWNKWELILVFSVILL